MIVGGISIQWNVCLGKYHSGNCPLGKCLWGNWPSAIIRKILSFIALCEYGWTFHDGRCYFVGRSANQLQAEERCKGMNATLTILRTYAQLYFMTTLQLTRDTWIGLTDSAQEGDWQWSNGEAVMMTNWGINQPNGGMSENCAVMNKSDTFRWHDRPCMSINDYVCEKGMPSLFCVFICLYLNSCYYCCNL